jgi:hypothetical protein
MSTVLVIAPAVVAGWPVITAAVTAAVGSMGFAMSRESAGTTVQTETRNRAEIDVEDSEVLGESFGPETIRVERDGLIATFSRDARGALKVCVEGGGLSKSELKRVGEELIGRVTQQYAYHRLVTELKQRSMEVVNEEVDADRTVRLRVRNWQ